MGDRAFASATELLDEIRDRHIGCVELHDFPLPSLRRCSQIAVRFILANLQRAEHAVEVSRFGRVAIGAAEARMNHPDMASAPLRAAFFDRPAIARADRKLHCAEIARLAEVTPVVAFPRHLVHVGKVLAQIAVAGFDKAAAMLKTDTTDISRVEGHDIGFDLQGPDIGDDQIMGDSAIGDLDRRGSLWRTERRRTERWPALAVACAGGGDPRASARNVRPFILFDARVAEIGAELFPGRGDRRRSDRNVRQRERRLIGTRRER